MTFWQVDKHTLTLRQGCQCCVSVAVFTLMKPTVSTWPVCPYESQSFHPAWGMLDELKALLVNDGIWKVFSAMFPPHILKTVMQKVLTLDCIKIQLMWNHPNTVYTTHQVQGSIEDPRNYECFFQHPFNLDTQPLVLIFFDDKVLTKKVTQHLDNKLPPEHCGWGVVQHYHSGMSEK